MGKKTLREILVAARKRISEPSRWTQGAYARNQYGAITDHSAPDAVCWCVEGALLRETQGLVHLYNEAINYLDRLLPPYTELHTFNDRTKHAQVLKFLDAAIEKLSKRELKWVPLTPAGTVLSHLMASTREQAIKNLMHDAAHMPYKTWENFEKRGYRVEEYVSR